MTTVEVLRLALDIVETEHRRDIDGVLRDATWEAPIRRFGRPPTIQTRRRRAARKALTDTLKARGEYGVFPHHGIDQWTWHATVSQLADLIREAITREENRT